MTILSVVIAYFLGAIPFAYLVVRLTQKIDIRQVGSGNVGATNALRAAGKGWGLLTLLLDAAKGFAAVSLAQFLTQSTAWTLSCAVVAVLGHMFPVFLRFRGGKGVATGSGACLAAAPAAVGISAMVFLSALIITRYVSLGSICAALCFPIAALALGESVPVILAGSACAVLITAKHSGNIRRMLDGTERRFALSRKE